MATGRDHIKGRHGPPKEPNEWFGARCGFAALRRNDRSFHPYCLASQRTSCPGMVDLSRRVALASNGYLQRALDNCRLGARAREETRRLRAQDALVVLNHNGKPRPRRQKVWPLHSRRRYTSSGASFDPDRLSVGVSHVRSVELAQRNIRHYSACRKHYGGPCRRIHVANRPSLAGNSRGCLRSGLSSAAALLDSYVPMQRVWSLLVALRQARPTKTIGRKRSNGALDSVQSVAWRQLHRHAFADYRRRRLLILYQRSSHKLPPAPTKMASRRLRETPIPTVSADRIRALALLDKKPWRALRAHRTRSHSPPCGELSGRLQCVWPRSFLTRRKMLRPVRHAAFASVSPSYEQRQAEPPRLHRRPF